MIGKNIRAYTTGKSRRRIAIVLLLLLALLGIGIGGLPNGGEQTQPVTVTAEEQNDEPIDLSDGDDQTDDGSSGDQEGPDDNRQLSANEENTDTEGTDTEDSTETSSTTTENSQSGEQLDIVVNKSEMSGQVDSVMPGDSGSVTMRAELLERDTETVESVELYLLLRLSDTAENGVNEPELDAGDSPGEDGGELQDHTEISVWIDEGIFTGNGELEELPVIGDDTVAEGTLAEVADSDPKGTGDGEYRIRIDGADCFSPGDEVYVSFEWRIPDTVGNIIQSDSATFQVAFDPRPCTEG